MTGREGKEVTGSVHYCVVNKCDCGKVSMTSREGKEVTGSVQCCAVNKCHCGKANMIVHEGKEVTGSMQCYAMERFHSGKASMTVQRQTASEPYVCLSQGPAKRPAQLVAMQWKHMVEMNNKIAEPRPGYLPGLAYGTAL